MVLVDFEAEPFCPRYWRRKDWHGMAVCLQGELIGVLFSPAGSQVCFPMGRVR